MALYEHEIMLLNTEEKKDLFVGIYFDEMTTISYRSSSQKAGLIVEAERAELKYSPLSFPERPSIGFWHSIFRDIGHVCYESFFDLTLKNDEQDIIYRTNKNLGASKDNTRAILEKFTEFESLVKNAAKESQYAKFMGLDEAFGFIKSFDAFIKNSRTIPDLSHNSSKYLIN